jgi:alkylhydroperoxidase family enzyme
MYQRQQDHWGYIPNYAKTFSHRPEVMARWGRLLAEIRRPVDDRRFELVTFAAALELRHSPCSLGHGKMLAAIIGAENVIALANGEEPEALTPAEIAMVKFARDIARDASSISAEQVAELKDIHGFSDEDLFDIAAIAAGRSFFTKILDSLGSQTDVSFMSMDPRLREPLTVGRPISQSPLEFIPTISS